MGRGRPGAPQPSGRQELDRNFSARHRGQNPGGNFNLQASAHRAMDRHNVKIDKRRGVQILVVETVSRRVGIFRASQ